MMMMIIIIIIIIIIINHGNRTNWSTIQEVIRWVITSMITPNLYATKSYNYQLIVSITKCKKHSKSTVEKRQSKS